MKKSYVMVSLACCVNGVVAAQSGTDAAKFATELNRLEPRAFLMSAEEAADPVVPAVADLAQAAARLDVFIARWRAAPPPGPENRAEVAHGKKNLRELIRGDFFVWRRLFRSGWLLERAGALTPETRAGLLEIARDVIKPQERGTNNRSYHFALGAWYAAALFPGEPGAAQWRAYAEAVWQDWWKKGDGYEPGYVGHHLPTIIELGELLGHREELASERARLAWRRFADHISASGRAVQPGDPGGPGDQGDYVEGLAEAARVGRDPIVLGAAQRALAAMVPPKYPLPPNVADPARLARLVAEATHELAAAKITPAPAQSLAEIQELYPTTLHEPERAVLSLPGAPGGNAPYVAFWLHDRAETLFHSHEDQRGTLLHYEVAGARLLGGATWTKWPGGANAFVVAPAACEFPVMIARGLPTGQWLPASADLRGLRYFQEAGGWKRGSEAPAEQGQRALLAPDGLGYSWGNPEAFFGAGDRVRPRTVTLRVVAIPADEMTAAVKRRDHQLNGLSFDTGFFWYRDYRSILALSGPLELRVTPPALAGPAGRKALADTAKLPAGLVVTQYAAGVGTEGKTGRVLSAAEAEKLIRIETSDRGPVWRITCPPGRLDFTWPLDGSEVDLMDGQPRAEFDYQIVAAPGDAPVLRAPLTLALDDVRPRGLYADGQQGGRLVASSANRQGDDAGTRFTYADCWAAGASWTRSAVLTGAGTLVVLDEYSAAASQGEVRAGSVWQFGKEPKRGLNWFTAPAREGPKEAGVRITFAADGTAPLELAVQRQEKFQREVTFASSAAVLMRAGLAPVRIVSVIEPWSVLRDGAEAPARVEFTAAGSVLAYAHDGTTISFTKDGGWSVVTAAKK